MRDPVAVVNEAESQPSLINYDWCQLTPQVLEILKKEKLCKRRGQVLLQRPVCQQAFRALLGIGSGRFFRLKHAAAVDASRAPVDGRQVQQAKSFDTRNRIHMFRRAAVTCYLQELYDTVSEPMPEANQSVKEFKALTEPGDLKLGGPKKFRRHGGRRPKHAAKQCRDSGNNDRTKMRFLPPGSFTHYLLMFREQNKEFEDVSLKLFTKVSWLPQSLGFNARRCAYARLKLTCNAHVLTSMLRKLYNQRNDVGTHITVCLHLVHVAQ